MTINLDSLPESDVRLPARRITPQQAKLARLIAQGHSIAEAGRQAGYATRHSAHDAQARPIVRAEIARMSDDGALSESATRERVVANLVRIMESPASTAGEKIRACRLVAELKGYFRPDPVAQRPKSRFDGMTLEELEEQERLYDRLEASYDERKTDS